MPAAAMAAAAWSWVEKMLQEDHVTSETVLHVSNTVLDCIHVGGSEVIEEVNGTMGQKVSKSLLDLFFGCSVVVNYDVLVDVEADQTLGGSFSRLFQHHHPHSETVHVDPICKLSYQRTFANAASGSQSDQTCADPFEHLV